MYNTNMTIVAGYLGRDPEPFTLDNGTVGYNFSLAVTPRKKVNGEKQTVWFSYTTFSEYHVKYLKKGAFAQVTGSLYELQTYIDKNGNPQAKPVYNVADVSIIKWANGDNEEGDDENDTLKPTKKNKKKIPF